MYKTRLVCSFAVLLMICTFVIPTTVHAIPQFSPSSVNFGAVPINTSSVSVTITITHTANATMYINQVVSSLPEFTITSGKLPITVAAHGSTTLQVTFRPDSVASFNGTITVYTSGLGQAATSFNVSGNGVAVPLTYLLSPSASSLSFGNLLVGSTSSQSLLLTNSGTGKLTISQVTASGPGFSVSGFSGAVSLAAGQSLSLALAFAPVTTGNAVGSISIASNATNSPSTIFLSGVGVQPLLSVVPASVSFGSVTMGLANSQTMTIQNPGTATLTVTQASLSGSSYSMSGLTLPLSVAPGASATFNISFAPASASSLPGSLVLVSNAPTSPTTVAMSGIGVAKILQLSASTASLSFGSLSIGTSASQNITVTNTGNSTVTISQIAASGTGFTIGTTALPISLAAGQATSFSVTCAPASAGTLTGSVTVTSNATNSPLTIALAGTATTPYSVNLTWTPSSSSYEGFNLYRSSVSGGPYAKVTASVVPSPSYTDTSVGAGQTYYYVATEVDSSGNESPYSSEVSALIP